VIRSKNAGPRMLAELLCSQVAGIGIDARVDDILARGHELEPSRLTARRHTVVTPQGVGLSR
jgi:hypothetical protein